MTEPAFAEDGATHRLGVRVYYEDTDFSGLVYHARYLHFLERGRTEFLRACGVGHAELLARPDPLVFAVRRMSLDFVDAARIDDALVVETRFLEARGARVSVEQGIVRAGAPVVSADVEVAVLTPDGRPRRAPADLLSALADRLALTRL